MAISSAAITHAQSLHDVSSAGTQAWSQAARTGRADMLVLGDSVVWVGGHGWDAGLTNAASNTFGLAGTGLIADSDLTGQGYGFQTLGGAFSYNFNTDLSSIPVAQQGYALRTGASGVSPDAGQVATGFGYLIDSNATLDPSAAYNWDLYTAGGPGGGSTGAYRRIGNADAKYYYNTLQTDAPVSIPSSTGGLTKVTFSFDSNTISDEPQQFTLQNATNMSVLYSRMSIPNAKGVTLSSLGYGGQNTHAFYNNVMLAMSSEGRETFLQSLVDGSNSGKLNIVISEGLNDRNDTGESIHDVGLGDTAAGFKDNMSSLISLLRTDWVDAGESYNNLSFTLVGSYQDSYEAPDGSGPLHLFATQEMAMAQADPMISFVDLYDDAPNYATANALGYSEDGVHPTWAGSQVYSNLVMGVIAAPEPSTLGIVGVSLALFARRRRRR